MVTYLSIIFCYWCLNYLPSFPEDQCIYHFLTTRCPTAPNQFSNIGKGMSLFIKSSENINYGCYLTKSIICYIPPLPHAYNITKLKIWDKYRIWWLVWFHLSIITENAGTALILYFILLPLFSKQSKIHLLLQFSLSIALGVIFYIRISSCIAHLHVICKKTKQKNNVIPSIIAKLKW